MKRVLAIAALATLVSGCTLFGDGPPSNTCKTDQDCFRAQGEHCNQERHVCELAPDAGITVDAPRDAP